MYYTPFTKLMDIGLPGPSAYDLDRVCVVDCNYGVSYSVFNGSNFYYGTPRDGIAVRPVVSIPKSDVVDIKLALGI